MNFEKKYDIIVNNIESYGNNSFDVKKILINCNKFVESEDSVIDISDVLYTLIELYENQVINRHIAEDGHVSFTKNIVNDLDGVQVRK